MLQTGGAAVWSRGWDELIPRGRAAADDHARGLAATRAALTSTRSPDRLAAAEEIARAVVLHGPGAVTPHLGAIRGDPPSPSEGPSAWVGWLALLDLRECTGAARLGAGELAAALATATRAPRIEAAERRSLGLAAVALGDDALATSLDYDLPRRLGEALLAASPEAAAQPFWDAIEGFPDDTLGWSELLWIARAYVVRLERRDAGTTARWLHDAVRAPRPRRPSPAPPPTIGGVLPRGTDALFEPDGRGVDWEEVRRAAPDALQLTLELGQEHGPNAPWYRLELRGTGAARLERRSGFAPPMAWVCRLRLEIARDLVDAVREPGRAAPPPTGVLLPDTTPTHLSVSVMGARARGAAAAETEVIRRMEILIREILDPERGSGGDVLERVRVVATKEEG